MAFYCDKMTWKAGNLTKDPYFRTYPDGNETVYLSLAIDHEKDNTEYLELQGRGQIKEYIRTETFKSGDFVIAGGTLGTRKKQSREVPILRLAIISHETSLNYEILNWDYLKAGTRR